MSATFCPSVVLQPLSSILNADFLNLTFASCGISHLIFEDGMKRLRAILTMDANITSCGLYYASSGHIMITQAYQSEAMQTRTFFALCV